MPGNIIIADKAAITRGNTETTGCGKRAGWTTIVRDIKVTTINPLKVQTVSSLFLQA